MIALAVSNPHLTEQAERFRQQSEALPKIQDVEHISPKIKQVLGEFKQALEVLYGEQLASLVLYGSVARDEATDDSDVDVLVVLKGKIKPAVETRRMGDASTQLLLQYDELISVVPMSQQDFLYRDSPLLLNIRQDGIFV